MSLNHQDDISDQEISDDKSGVTGEYIFSSDGEDDNLDHQSEGICHSLACPDKSLRTTFVPMPITWRHYDTDVAHTLLPYSWTPTATMAPALLNSKGQSVLPQYRSWTVHHPPG
jgi:hypothetical protein